MFFGSVHISCKTYEVALILGTTMTNMVYALRSNCLVTIGLARHIWVGRAPGLWIRIATAKEKRWLGGRTRVLSVRSQMALDGVRKSLSPWEKEKKRVSLVV